jgi:hypothetical protein
MQTLKMKSGKPEKIKSQLEKHLVTSAAIVPPKPRDKSGKFAKQK